MKKKILVFIFAGVLVLTVLSGCSARQGTKLGDSNKTGMILISEEQSLMYRKDTRVIYIAFNETQGYGGYGYMSPYISENGKFCRYINDEIVEIND